VCRYAYTPSPIRLEGAVPGLPGTYLIM